MSKPKHLKSIRKFAQEIKTCEHILEFATEKQESYLVERDVNIGQQTPQAVNDRRSSHRRWGVEVSVNLRSGTGEVEHRRAGGAVNSDSQADGGTIVEEILGRGHVHFGHALTGGEGSTKREALEIDNQLQDQREKSFLPWGERKGLNCKRYPACC